MKKRTPQRVQKQKSSEKGVKRAAEALERLEPSDTDTDVMHIKAEAQADRTKAVKTSLPKVKDALQHIESQEKEDKGSQEKP